MAELFGPRAELLPDLVVFLIFSGIPLLRNRVLVTLPTHPFPVLVYLRTLESSCSTCNVRSRGASLCGRSRGAHYCTFELDGLRALVGCDI